MSSADRHERHRRWTPGLAGQLGIVLLVALLASNLLAMLVLQRTGDLLHPISRGEVLQRLKLAYRIALDVAPAQVALLNHNMSSAATRVSVDAQANVAPLPMQPEERRLVADLRVALQLPATADVRMQLERSNGSPARENILSPAGWAPLRLRSSVPLAEGQWLNVVQHPVGRYEWQRLLAYTLPVSVIPVLLISLLFVRRLTQPIRRLAKAAEQLQPGQVVTRLPVSGPYEARELTMAFNALQARIAGHVEARTRMLAMISHDFGTPITELRLMLELLPPSEERQDMLDSLADLQRMVAETLAFIRDDASQEPTVAFDPVSLLDELRRRYERLGAPLQWSSQGALAERQGRPLALKRALMNLLDNGLRHGGAVQVVVSGEPAGGLRIEVRDDGPGLPDEVLEQVFEPFVRGRGDAHGDASAGLGLGLAIVRSGIHAQGGTVVLENRHPGLAAVIRLPP